MRTRAWWIVAALACAIPAEAKVSSSCASEDDPVRRLACYDEESGRAAEVRARGFVAVSTPPAQQPNPLTGAASGSTSVECPRSGLEDRWALKPCRNETTFQVRPHQPVYLIGRHSDNPHQPDDGADNRQPDPWEAKFQLSLKARVLGSKDGPHALWLGYTQQSSWQVGNETQSRPFRETNYQPEVIYAYAPKVENFEAWRLLTLAYLHESNGRSGVESRSWNRVYAQFGFEKDFGDGRNLELYVRPWVRVREEAMRDDNPDITDFLGHGDVTAVLRNCGHTVTLMGRGNARTRKGAFQATYSSPRHERFGPLKLYVQFFTGYGESLIDYNWKQTTVGIGVALNDVVDDPPGPADKACGKV